MKHLSGTSSLVILHMVLLTTVVILLALSFHATNHGDALDSPSDWPVLDALGHRDLARLREVTPATKMEALDPNGMTPLMLAVRMDYPEAVEDLLSRGANVNHGSDRNGSPLMIALALGNPTVAQELIRRRADVNYHTSNGDSPLLAAIRGGERRCIDLILASGAARYPKSSRRNPLTEACASDGTLEVLQHLLLLKFNPNWIARDGVPPIVSAAAYDCPKCVRALLDAGADVNLADASGRTAWSVGKSFADVREVLLSADAFESPPE